VPKDVSQGLDKSVDDFRNKKLFDFGFDEPSKIEVHDGAKPYFFTKGGQDWWSDGKKLDAEGVQTLIDRIRGLSATRFVDSGFTAPLMNIMIISNEGKRVEKVMIASAAGHFIAKREDDPSLYEMDSSAVTDLQKAAADVKPAPAEGKK
jgi:hypothetical protein